MRATEEHISQPDHEFHRKAAAQCFNRTWGYLEQKNRSQDDDHMMLSLAHASRYHWSIIGKPWNFTTGDTKISRAYAALTQRNPALILATEALQITNKHN